METVQSEFGAKIRQTPKRIKVPFLCLDIHKFQYQSLKQYKAWVRAHNRNIKEHGLGLDGFFFDPNTGAIDLRAAYNAIQGAIDEGKNGLGMGKTHGYDFPLFSHEPEPEPQDQGDDCDRFLFTNLDLYNMGCTDIDISEIRHLTSEEFNTHRRMLRRALRQSL
jgi:hypothetical protein